MFPCSGGIAEKRLPTLQVYVWGGWVFGWAGGRAGGCYSVVQMLYRTNILVVTLYSTPRPHWSSTHIDVYTYKYKYKYSNTSTNTRIQILQVGDVVSLHWDLDVGAILMRVNGKILKSLLMILLLILRLLLWLFWLLLLLLHTQTRCGRHPLCPSTAKVLNCPPYSDSMY